MQHPCKNAARCLALAAVLVPLGAGQDRHQTAVRVADTTDAALPGANVFVLSLDTGLQVARRTDAAGGFVLELRRGQYRVTAASTGFEAASATIEVPSADQDVLVLRLAPAALEQSVVVSGSREEELLEDTVAKVDLVSWSQLLDSGYERVSDVLAEETGIVTRSGSSGSRSETQIQGIDSRQSLILLDGYPVVGARGVKRGIVNLDRQSPNRLDREIGRASCRERV